MIIQRNAALACLLVLGFSCAHAEKGFFVAASIGSANLDEKFDGLRVDDNATSFRITGGWNFNDYFAIEAGYHDFGDFEQRFTINGVSNSASLSADGFTLGMKATRPLSTKISVYGRTGMFFWDGDAEVNNVSQATPEDTNPYFGAGLGYAMSDRLQLIGDWTRYKLEGSSSNVFSVGFQFRF